MKGKDEIKLRIARRAAQLLYDEGLSVSQARRKAAKAYGSGPRLSHSHCLPNDQEIYAQLIVQSSTHNVNRFKIRLRELRQRALRTLNLLEPFSPYIVGDVADGLAIPYSIVSVIAYADHPEEIEDFLWQQDIIYDTLAEYEVSRLPTPGNCLIFELDCGDVECLVLPRAKRHQRLRSPITGKTIARLTSQQLETLIDS